MSKKARRQHRASRLGRGAGKRILVGIAAVVLTVTGALTIWIVNSPTRLVEDRSATFVGSVSDAPADEPESRPVYPYSIIPGGAGTVEV